MKECDTASMPVYYISHPPSTLTLPNLIQLSYKTIKLGNDDVIDSLLNSQIKPQQTIYSLFWLVLFASLKVSLSIDIKCTRKKKIPQQICNVLKLILFGSTQKAHEKKADKIINDKG